MSAVLEQLNREIGSVVEEAAKSLVEVNSGGSGAGTIWHPDGLIVTNAHVLQRSSAVVNLRDGKRLPAKVIAYDEMHDLAALMVEPHSLPSAKLGDSAALRPGHWVFAIGHPWGVRGAVTAGVVIGVGPDDRGPGGRGRELIAAHLQLRPGHSGGPLVDDRGRLVGINAMMNGPGLGLAVPAHVVVEFLRRALGSIKTA